MKLTKKERLMLFNQYKIMELLCPDEADDCKNAQDILWEGYESEYITLVEYMDIVPVEVCEEVKDILQMFRILNDSYEQLEDKNGIEKHEVMFQGFDGNEEGNHYCFAKFYITSRCYEEFNEIEKNSHCNKLDEYRNKLNNYKVLEPYKMLSKEKMLFVLGK